MPDNDLFRRSLDAGVAFTQLTRKRAEKIVRELVKNGEVSRDQATARVEEMLERSRQNSEAILAIVRKEIDDRVAALNLVTRDDLTNLVAKLGLPGRGGRTASRPATPAAPGQKTPARPAVSTQKPRTTATKTAVKKVSAAKKTAPSAATSTPRPSGTAKKATKSAKKA
ncbi:MAG: hypothetical protein NVSMB12_18940 [Acidimicrobiales bacterium]